MGIARLVAVSAIALSATSPVMNSLRLRGIDPQVARFSAG
jgi:hypothetical protein